MTLSLEEKYALLVKFYCNVKGAIQWHEGSSSEKAKDGNAKYRMIEIARYLQEYESAVKELEAK